MVEVSAHENDVRPMRKRCPQCWRVKTLVAFRKADGRTGRFCLVCRRRYGNWGQLTTSEKLARLAPRRDPKPSGRVHFVLRSHNKKTGPIPVSMSERGTCAPSCAFYNTGCYAQYGKNGAHWKRVRQRGLTWERFLARIRDLPEGQLWRHNEAGDLAGEGGSIDPAKLSQLVAANTGRRGFTYTHKTSADNYPLLQWANLHGFAVNLSADTLEEADALFQSGHGDDVTNAGPVVVVLDAGAPDRGNRTPAGRHVVMCPAQTEERMTCSECQLCAQPFRRAIIGFRAHGQAKGIVSDLVRTRRAEP